MLRAFCVTTDITSQYPFIRTKSPEVFVYPKAKTLCLSLRNMALVLSWDECSENFLDKSSHPKFTKINLTFPIKSVQFYVMLHRRPQVRFLP